MLLFSPNKKWCLSTNLWLTGPDTLAGLGPVFRHNTEVINSMELKLLSRTADK